MSPCISNLEREVPGEATVEPQLHCVVAGIAIGFIGVNVADVSEETIVSYQLALILNQACYRTCHSQSSASNLQSRISTTAIARGTAASNVRSNVISVYIAPPDVEAMVTDVRSFERGVFEERMRNSQVPLIALGWPVVHVHRGKARIRINARDVGSQAGIDRVETAASRTVSQRRTGAVPARACAHGCGPWWIAGHAKQIFDDLCTAHVAAKARSDRGLTGAPDVPRNTHTRLPSLFVGIDCCSANSHLLCFGRGHETSVEVGAVVERRIEVRDAIVCFPCRWKD